MQKRLIKKLIIDITPHYTLRVWLFFVDSVDWNVDEVTIFNMMSILGGADKIEKDCLSWELDYSAAPWLTKKFFKGSRYYEVSNTLNNLTFSEIIDRVLRYTIITQRAQKK